MSESEIGGESDSPLWRIGQRRRGIEDLHEFLKDVNDGCFVGIEPTSKLLFQARELLGEDAITQQRFAHFDAGVNSEQTHPE